MNTKLTDNEKIFDVQKDSLVLVAGHTDNFKLGNINNERVLWKKSNGTEAITYQEILSEQNLEKTKLLRPFLLKLYECEINGDNSTLGLEYLMNDHSTLVVDVKIGSRLYSADASDEKRQRMVNSSRKTTSEIWGFRLSGYQLVNGDSSADRRAAALSNRARAKQLKTLDESILYLFDVIKEFINEQHAACIKQRQPERKECKHHSSTHQTTRIESYDLSYSEIVERCKTYICSIVDQLTDLSKAISHANFLTFIGSSILIVMGFEAPRVKLVDFAHTELKPSEDYNKVLEGIDCLTKVYKTMLIKLDTLLQNYTSNNQ